MSSTWSTVLWVPLYKIYIIFLYFRSKYSYSNYSSSDYESYYNYTVVRHGIKELKFKKKHVLLNNENRTDVIFNKKKFDRKILILISSYNLIFARVPSNPKF